jgi:glycosyltransferase involved in cell wall biosynthesis
MPYGGRYRMFGSAGDTPRRALSDACAERLRVVFVGAFADAVVGGGTGGQLVACRAILRSPLSERVDWILIDSTMRSIPAPTRARRIAAALRRAHRFARAVSSRPGAVLLFASCGGSFIEKGIYALIASTMGLRVVFAPRSGLILDAVRRSRVWRHIVRYIMRRCDAVLCQSRSWQEEYSDISGLPPERFAIFSNTVDVAAYAHIAGRVVRRADTVRVLYLGWFEAYKGILDLVDAIFLHRAELQNAHFAFHGSGSQRVAVTERVRAFGLSRMVTVGGWLDEKGKLSALEKADLLVVPSHTEGLPNALLEGMAAGLAVVATRVGAIPEVLDDGEAGVLVDPRNPHDLGRALAGLVQDHQRRIVLGRVARRRVVVRHDPAKNWRSLYHALAPRQERRIGSGVLEEDDDGTS